MDAKAEANIFSIFKETYERTKWAILISHRFFNCSASLNEIIVHGSMAK